MLDYAMKVSQADTLHESRFDAFFTKNDIHQDFLVLLVRYQDVVVRLFQ